MERHDSVRNGSFADAGGVRIRIHHLGGTGPPLVCVHATGFHGRVWEPFTRLREHFTVIALDQRGHGDSDKPESGYEWTNFGDDVLAVVEHLDLEAPAGIGHSAGATALILAESKRPGTFSRVALLDPTLLPPEFRRFAPSGVNPMSEQARRRRAVWESPEEMIERLRAGTPLAGWEDEFLRAYAVYGLKQRADGSFELKCPPEIEALVYAAGPNDAWDRLIDVTCPALIATGESSPMWDAERGAQAAALLGDGRAVEMRGGHFFPMEHPDSTSDLVVPFLNGEG